MKRLTSSTRSKSSREAEHLVNLATGRAESGSWLEDSYWHRQLQIAVGNALATGDDTSLNQALDRLFEQQAPGFEVLADCIEQGAETVVLPNGAHALLFAMPVLAWSPFAIPTGALPEGMASRLQQALCAQVFAEGVQVTVGDYLFSPDQMPQSYADTCRMAHKIAARHDQAVTPLAGGRYPNTLEVIADVRYLLGVVTVAPGEPVFAWHRPGIKRQVVLEQWRRHGTAALRDILGGCTCQVLAPNAFFAACREAEREVRGFTVAAMVTYLGSMLRAEPAQIHAVVAAGYERQIEEYRIGFWVTDPATLVHGAVWPLLDGEDDAAATLADIRAALEGAGVQDVTVLDAWVPLDYCEDCGSPLFPNANGELCHPDMPDGDPRERSLLH